MSNLDRAIAELATLRDEETTLREWLSTNAASIARLETYIEQETLYSTPAKLVVSTPAATPVPPPAVSPLPLAVSPPLRGRAPILPTTPRSTRGVGTHAVSLCVATIRESGKPITTAKLMRMLHTKGITVGGLRPLGNLAGALSRSPLLVNRPKKGWTLAQPPEEASRQASLPLPLPEPPLPAPKPKLNRMSNPSGTVLRTLEICIAYIRAKHPRPVLTDELLRVVHNKGVRFNAKRPAANLAANLGRSGIVENHGRTIGWALVEHEQPEPPDTPEDKLSEEYAAERLLNEALRPDSKEH